MRQPGQPERNVSAIELADGVGLGLERLFEPAARAPAGELPLGMGVDEPGMRRRVADRDAVVVGDEPSAGGQRAGAVRDAPAGRLEEPLAAARERVRGRAASAVASGRLRRPTSTRVIRGRSRLGLRRLGLARGTPGSAPRRSRATGGPAA